MQQQLTFRYWSCKVWVTFRSVKTGEFPSLLKVLSKWLSKSGSGRFTGLEKSESKYEEHVEQKSR